MDTLVEVGVETLDDVDTDDDVDTELDVETLKDDQVLSLNAIFKEASRTKCLAVEIFSWSTNLASLS